MAAGEYELAGGAPFINRNLDKRGELRQVLNLIDNASSLVCFYERAWVLGDTSSLIWPLEVHYRQGWKGHFA
jgi:hypothetical protein